LLSEQERAVLSGSFRAAYVDSLLRGVPLAGVLGGDFVHGWPDDDPSGWVQNWRGSDSAVNSWGLPRLVLAVRGLRAGANMGRVFIVRGTLLDHYGKSAGINGANGDTGYGSPRGYEFFYKGNLSQRFDLGLITVDREGRGTFVPEDPPSLSFSVPAETGVFQGGVPSVEAGETVREAFVTAVKMAVDRGVESMIPDSPGEYITVTKVPEEFAGGEVLKGLYIQTFNGRTIALVLADSPRLPLFPRFIAAPFLDTLLDAPKSTVPGGENLNVQNLDFSGGDNFSRSLMAGFMKYGIPLTDPLPYTDENGSPREAQRFSKGWLVVPAL
jgi:hypothetical protein